MNVEAEYVKRRMETVKVKVEERKMKAYVQIVKEFSLLTSFFPAEYFFVFFWSSTEKRWKNFSQSYNEKGENFSNQSKQSPWNFFQKNQSKQAFNFSINCLFNFRLNNNHFISSK